MQVHKAFVWYKLTELIKTEFREFHPKITGLNESHDHLKFIITVEKQVILHTQLQIYKITIVIKPAVCELITNHNFSLFKQYFADFLRPKREALFKSKRQKMTEVRWNFTLDSIPQSQWGQS
jgi:hypothetical protein